MAKTRKCPWCEERKELTTEFWTRDKNNKEGFRYTCKICTKNYRDNLNKKKKSKSDIEREVQEVERFKLFKRMEKEKLKAIKNKMRGETYNPKKTYRVDNRKNVVRNVRDLVDFTGKVHYQDSRLLTLKHKNGRCETFLKVDFKIGEYEIEELY